MIRKPLLHFLLLGALLFAGRQWLTITIPDAQLTTIRISAADLDRLRREWRRETGRAPSTAELQASTQRFVDEALLLREALRLGLDRTDPVARERQITNMRFAFPETPKSDQQLLQEARALGMHARDLVVRRRLVQVMEMRIAKGAEFSEAALREYVAKHPERYAQPARYAFRHVYFNGNRPQAEVERVARAQLSALRAGRTPEIGGDPFLLGDGFAPLSLAQIERAFGAAFAKKLGQARPGRWIGPLRSAYGWHLVLLEGVEPAQGPEFERVRQRAAYALLAEREKEVLREELARLRGRYRVEVATEVAVPLTVGMTQ